MSRHRLATAVHAIRHAMPSITLAAALGLAPLGPPTPARAEDAATCDFDADGKGDLAVGVPGEDFGRGGVNVQYNRGGFLATPAFLQGKHPDGDKMLDGAQFGAALACGDFNGDGVGDLAVGGPHTPVGGTVWIFWGKPAFGLDASSYWVFHQNGGAIPGSSTGVFGHALASGDFNGDGVADLAVGDPSEPVPGTHHNTGTVLMVPGKKGGLTFEGVQQVWGWSVVEGDSVGWFGWSLAAAPLVSGAGDELVVGAPLAGWPRDYQHAGRVYLFRGHGGLAPYLHIDEAALASAGLPNLYAPPQNHAWFGYSVATGDFNRDSKVDLAVGIPGKSVSGKRAGAAVIVPGTGLGLDLANERYLVQEALGGASESPDMYGWALAAGDWNLDRHDDLAVGAPYENVEASHDAPGADRAGAVFVHHGGPDLVSGSGKILRQGQGVTPGVPEAHDWFGLSLASVRLGSGNGAYLVIGVPGQRSAHPNADCNKVGAVQLGVSFADSGPLADPDFLLHQDTGAPFNVGDQRECTTASTPWIMNFGDPASPAKGGEFFGWSIGS